MSEQAGRLHLDVEADTRGLGARLRRQIAIETADLRARLKVEINSRGVKAEMKRVVADLETRNKVRLTVELQTRGLNAQVKAVAAEASAAAKVRLGVEVDGAQARAEVESATSKVESATATVKVDADTKPAERDVEAAKERIKSRSATLDVRIKPSALTTLTRVGGAATKIVGIIGLIGGAVGPILSVAGALGQVVGGLFAIVSAAGPAVGALALIPSVVGVLGQSIGIAVAGFSGLGDAISASDEVAASGARSAVAQGQAREAAARGVQRAQEALVAAQANVGRVAEQNARSVEAAERRVADAQAAARRAQVDLTQARRDAVERLEDMRLALSGAALDEEGARLAVLRAEERVRDVNSDYSTSNLDRAEADLALRQAKQRLSEVIESNGDLRDEAKASAKAGVDGATEVVAAQADVADSNRDVTDAERELVRARRDAAQDTRDALDGVRDAQRDLADATAETSQAAVAGMGAAAAATSAYDDALAELSPTARGFVRFMRDEWLPAWREVKVAAQDALLPSAQEALTNLLALTTPVMTIVKDTAGVLGDLMVLASETITSPLWQQDLLTIGANNADALGILGVAAINLLTPLKDILVVVGDGDDSLLTRFANWTLGLSENAKAAVATGRENGKLADFLNRAGDRIAQWGRIIGNIATGIFNIGRQATPAGQALTDSFEGATEDFVRWTETDAPKIRKFFDDLVPVTESVGRLLVEVGKVLGDIMSNPNNLALIESIEKQLLPAIRDMVNAFLDAGNGQALVDILVGLAKVVTNLVNSGAFGQFLDVLSAIVDALVAVSDNPIGQDVFKVLFTLLAVAAPLAVVVGTVGKLVNLLTKLSKIKGLSNIASAIRGMSSTGGTLPVPGGTGGGTGVDIPVGGTTGKGKTSTTKTPTTTVPKTGGGKLGRLGKLGGALGGLGLIGIGAGGVLSDDDTGSENAAKRDKAIADYFKRQDAGKPDLRGSVGLSELLGGTAPGTSAGRPPLAPAQSGARPGASFTPAPGSNPYAPKTAPNFIGPVQKSTGDAARAAEKGGKDTGQGFWNGLTSKLSQIGSAIGGWFTKWVINPFKDLFGINSPSTLFIGFAGDLIDGLIQGLGEMPGKVLRFLSGLGKDIVTGLGRVKDGWTKKFIEMRDSAGTRLTEALTKVTGFLTGLPSTIAGGFRSITTTWTQKFTDLRQSAANRMTEARDRVTGFLSTLPYHITNGFRSITSTWSSKFGSLRDTAYNVMVSARARIVDMLDRIRASFAGGVINIARAWDKVRAAAKTPIDFVVNTVYNKGIRSVWNKVAGIVNGSQLPELAFARGGVMPGYTPGRDVHQFTSPTGGTLNLSGGEAVMRPEWTKAIGSKAVDAMNAIAASGGVSKLRAMLLGTPGDQSRYEASPKVASHDYRTGGIVQRVQSFYDGGLISFGRYLQSLGYNVAEHPLFGGVAPVHTTGSLHYSGNAIDVNADGFPGGEPAAIDRIVGKAAGYGLRTIWRSAGHFDHAHFDTGRGGNILGSIGDAISGAFGGAAAKVTDFVGGNLRRAAAHVLDPLRKRISEKVGDTALGKRIGAVGTAGIDKVLSFLGTKDKVYDTGGVLRPGERAVNLSGKPEVVFNDSQWRVLSRLVSAGVGPVEQRPDGKSIGTLIEEGAIKFYVEQQRDQSYEQTLNSGLRRVAEFGMFGGRK